MKTYLITGVCGFIGSNLALRLLHEGNRVIGFDRYQLRHEKVLHEELGKFNNFFYHNIDLANYETYPEIDETLDYLFHLAANADIRFSAVYPDKDLYDGIIATYNILRFAKENNIKNIAYSSTSAVYGDPTVIPTPETYPFIQTSFYGAAKVAGEALVQAHCSSYGARAWIFRYASITGPRYSHGFIYNFYKKLHENPTVLYIHGGKDQRKTYLDVHDCVEAMLLIVNKSTEKINIYNIGNLETCSLVDSIPIITNYMNVNPRLEWSGNEVGWIGDSKINYLDVSKLQSLGWKPKYDIRQSIIRTLDWLDGNKWILEIREEL